MANRQTSPAHSPGDWAFDPVDLIIYDGPEKTAQAVATVERREEPTEDSDETSANGWVMAAAPALLRELKVAVRFLERVDPSAVEAVENELDQAVSLADMKAAIERAEGR